LNKCEQNDEDLYLTGLSSTFWLMRLSAASSMKSMQQRSTGLSSRAQAANRGSSGVFATNDLIGKKVWTRWPEDNHFYEAVITDYNPVEVQSTLGYVIVCLSLGFL
jgi:hypothetical protein